MHGSEVCHNKEEIKIKRYFFSFRAHITVTTCRLPANQEKWIKCSLDASAKLPGTHRMSHCDAVA